MDDDGKLRLLNLLPGWVVRRLMRARYDRMIGGGGEAELGELSRVVRSGDLAIDVGSNLGIYTFALSRIANRVIAFEPIPLLARFVRNQAMPNVTVKEIALSSQSGSRELSVPNEGAAYATLREDMAAPNRRIRVATRSLDSLALDPVGFMKVDVEGHEEAVLDGARETIARDRPRLLVEIEERHNPGGLDRIVKMLTALDYACWFFKDAEWHSFSEFDLARDQNPERIENPDGGTRYINNFLFMPDGQAPSRA